MAEADKSAHARPDLESLDVEGLRRLLADVQRRLTEVGGRTGSGGLQIRNVGDADVELSSPAGSTTVAPGEATELDPEPVRVEPKTPEASSAAAARPRSVVALRLSAGDSGTAVRVELGSLAGGAARLGHPEALVRTAPESRKGGRAGAAWRLVEGTSFELTVEGGRPVEVLVVGRGPLLDASALAQRAFAGLEQAGGEA